MKYLLLCYRDEQVWGKRGETERQQIMGETMQLAQQLKSSGQYLASSPLHPTSTATSVRVRDGNRLVTAGPFAVLERLAEGRTQALHQAQLKLYQTEKMASLSRLVAGVAHEVNSPLGALKSNLELLMVMFGRLATKQGREKEETKLFEHLVTLAHSSVLACARIVGVVRSLSSFARLDESEYKTASINDCIRTVVQLLDRGLGVGWGSASGWRWRTVSLRNTEEQFRSRVRWGRGPRS